MIFRDAIPQERCKGFVKFFKHGTKGDKGRGYGFIIEHNTGTEYFFHLVDLEFPTELCKTGVEVRFEVEETSRGLAAVDIHLAENNIESGVENESDKNRREPRA